MPKETHANERFLEWIGWVFERQTNGLASRLMAHAFQPVDLRKYVRYARSYPGVLPFLHLDHLYYDQQLSLKHFRIHRSRKALMASDHLPLVADFETRSSPRD